MKHLFKIILIFFLVSCCTHKYYTKPNTETQTEIISDTIAMLSIELEPINEEYNYIIKEETEDMLYENTSILEDEPIVETAKSVAQETHQSEYVPKHIIEPSFTDYVTKGDITYIMQDSMIVGNITVVDMTVSKGVPYTDIISEIESFNAEYAITDKIRIAPIMQAKLIDPSGKSFNIIPITPERQMVEPFGYTLWKWKVTPLTPGANSLLISVDIIIGTNIKSIEVYEGMIKVISNETNWDRFVNFFNENWKYLLSTLLLPFGIFLYSSIRKKKK